MGIIYSELDIERFRKFDNISFNSFSRINLFTGGNSSGKTSILEALALHSEQGIPTLWWLSTFRGGMERKTEEIKSDDWRRYFHNFNTSNEIELSGTYDGESWKVKINELTDKKEILDIIDEESYRGTEVQSSSEVSALVCKREDGDTTETRIAVVDGNGNLVFTDSSNPRMNGAYKLAGDRGLNDVDYETFNDIQKSKSKDILIDSLKKIDSRIEDITLVTDDNSKQLYVDVGLDQLVNINQLGGGIMECAETILGIFLGKGGIVLMDELGTGIHEDEFENFWSAINEALEKCDVQLFASTHSYGCINGLISSQASDYCLYRLEEDRKEPVYYNKKDLERAIESDFEVR